MEYPLNKQYFNDKDEDVHVDVDVLFNQKGFKNFTH